MVSRYYQLIAISLLSISALAQTNFLNRNDLLREHDIHSGVPVAVADMNGDGLDDIVALDNGTRLYIQYQTPDPARPYVRYDPPVNIDIDVQNDIIIADFNNDRANDIFIIGSYDRAKILYGNPFTYDFNLTYLVVTPFFSQGASSGDFNGDGWVDVVVLNDNGLNYTLLNDGAGNLAVGSLFNFVTVPPSDNSGNYGSVYTDFDMDGDLDFYIAKCRQGVNSQTDPRRINVLFVNDGNNNYTESAASYGLASGHQTWTADFGDIDNDGDQDVLMTQHDVMSELYENIDNDTFVNITQSTGLNIGGIPLQGMFKDFDNDGFQDILVSGDRIDYYHNNGDKTFTKEAPFGSFIFGTYALGDLNNDGFTDVYASRVIPFNNPDLLREDIMFLNEANNNHFLSLNLENTGGNQSAIGAMAILYGSWGIQIREVRGGEQYGVSNSHKLIFGLGDETTYDSLIIRWPDGEEESFNDLDIDQTWNLKRGGCYSTSQKIWDPLDFICGADSIILKLNNNATVVNWSSGETGDSIIVKHVGLYFAEYLDENNCLVRTEPVEVIVNPDTIQPQILYEGNDLLCNGDVAILSVTNGLGYSWVNGETGQSIDASETGFYYADVQGFCRTQRSDTLFLEFNIPPAPGVINDTFSIGESATLIAQGDSIVWYSDSTGLTLIGTGEEIVLDNLTETTTIYAGNLNANPGEIFQVGLMQHSGTKYNAPFINGGLLFDVLEPILLEEFTVYTDSAGLRIIEITDGENFFYDQQIDLQPGTTVITLNVLLPVGSYTISTNADMNNQEFGITSPLLWRSSQNVLYPYEVKDVISIHNSTLGEEFYYYFYDWKVSTSDRYCISDLVPVTALSDIDLSTEDLVLGDDLILEPNPTTGKFIFNSDEGSSFDFEIINLSGSVLMAGHVDRINKAYTFDIESFPAGIYVLRCRYDNMLATGRIIKL
jgi:hypothetical protein